MNLVPMSVLIGIVLVGGGILSGGTAKSHDVQRPDLDRWYGSLQNPKSSSPTIKSLGCCSAKDCHPTEAVRVKDSGQWMARVGTRHEDGIWELGEWLPVPWDAVLTQPNPVGAAVVCHGQSYKFPAAPAPVIWCFVPPPEF
jgi:hypothetical protein